jgi:hypothetical protein
MLAAEDAEKLTIPHMVLASNGEDAEVVKQYKAIIEGEGKIGEVRLLDILLLLARPLLRANILDEGGNLRYYAPWMDGCQSQSVQCRQSEGV